MPSAIRHTVSSTLSNPTPPNSVQQKLPADSNGSANVDPDNTVTTSTSPEANSKKRKRLSKPHILYTTTYKRPTWTYFHLTLLTPSTAVEIPSNPQTPIPTSTSSHQPALNPSNPTKDDNDDADEKVEGRDIDALTVSTLLLPPLTAFLGLTGSSIPLDVLKTEGRDVWIRVQRADARALRASLSGWIGSCESDLIPGAGVGGRVKVAWRTRGSAETLGLLVGDGMELFGG